MARLIGPSEASREVKSIVSSGTTAGLFRAKQNRPAVFYLDSAATQPADILHLDGTPISGGAVTTDAYSMLPLIQFPDGVDTLYVVVDGGPVWPVYAREDDRIDALAAEVAAGGGGGDGPGLAAHVADSTDVHGIADTSALVVTDDSRLSDARTPVAHAAAHGAAGSDPITVTQSQVAGLSSALSGKADLVGGLVPTSQIPPSSATFRGEVASEAAMLALPAVKNDYCRRTDTDPDTTWTLVADDPTVLANWLQTGSAAGVASVNTQSGDVVLGAADVGAAPTTRTITTTAPLTGGGDLSANRTLAVSDATTGARGVVQLAGDLAGTAGAPTVPGLAGKVATSRTITTTAPLTGGGDLSADRTLAVSDATTGAKGVVQLAGDLSGTAAAPTIATGAVTSAKIATGTIVDGDISASAEIAQSKVAGLATSLAAKAPLASPAFTGTPTGLIKSHVGLGNVDNTSDVNKPVSTATTTALAGKAGRGDDWINVKNNSIANAVGNGIADDTDALQAILDSLPIAAGNNIGGGIIYFPHGVYLVNKVTAGVILRLTNKPNVTILGAGDGTRIRVSTATADDLLRVETCNAFHIENVLFQFIGTAKVGNALNITTETPVGSVHSARVVNCKVSSNGAFKTAMDLMTVSGSSTVYSAQAAFGAGDVNGSMLVDLTGGPWLTTINSVATHSATLAAGITDSVGTITLNAPLTGSPPVSGFTVAVGTERMYVTGGGNTTTLTVSRGRGNDGTRTAHLAGAAVVTYSAVVDSTAPSSTSVAVGMARIQGPTAARVDVGLALATEHAGSPDLDVAGTKIDNFVVSRCHVAGIQVGNGTTGDVLCQWGESLDISESGYGIYLYAGSLTVDGGGSTGNLVDFRRFQPVSQAFKVTDWRTESCGMLYKMTGAATGGPLVTLAGVQVQQFRSEDGIVFQHLNSAAVTLINNSWSSSAVFQGNVFVACQGTAASPCHLTVINCVSSGGNLDPFTASPFPTAVTNIFGMSRQSAIGVASANSVLGVSLGSRLKAGAGFARGRTAVADANYTVVQSDTLIAYTSLTAARAVTLPAQSPSLLTGQEFVFVDESGSAGAFPITITPPAGTVSGAANYVINTAYGRVTLYTNGTNWFVR